jgi:tetratricopeptide (TPR) repeat protein
VSDQQERASVAELLEWLEDVSARQAGSCVVTLISEDTRERIVILDEFYAVLSAHSQFGPAWSPSLTAGSLVPRIQASGYLPAAHFTWLAVRASDEPEAEAMQLLEQLEGLGQLPNTPDWVQASRAGVFRAALGPTMVENAGDAADRAFCALGNPITSIATNVAVATRELHGFVSRQPLLADGGALGTDGPGSDARALMAAGWLQRLAQDEPVVFVIDEAHKAGPFLLALIDLISSLDARILVVLSGEPSLSEAGIGRHDDAARFVRIGGTVQTLDGVPVETDSLPTGRPGTVLALLATVSTSGLCTLEQVRRAAGVAKAAETGPLLDELLVSGWLRQIASDVFAFSNDRHQLAAQHHAKRSFTDGQLTAALARICAPRSGFDDDGELSTLIECRTAAERSIEVDARWEFARLLARYGSPARAAALVASSVETPLERALVAVWSHDDSLELFASSEDGATLVTEAALIASRYPSEAKACLARAMRSSTMSDVNDSTSRIRLAAARVFLAMGDLAGIDVALGDRVVELLSEDVGTRLASLAHWRSVPGLVTGSVDALARLTTIETLRMTVPGSAALALALLQRVELLERLGRLDTAEDALATAWEAAHILSTSKQPRPETAWRAVQWLGWTNHRRGDTSTALALLDQLFAEQLASVPEQHPAVLATRQWRARCLLGSGDVLAAHQELDHVLNERAKALPDDHPDLVDTHHWHAATLAREGNHAAAAVEFAEVVAHRERSLAADDEALLASRHPFGSALANTGRYDEALQQFDEVMSQRACADVEDAPRLVAVRHSRAVCLLFMGRHAEAHRELDVVVGYRRVALSAADPDLLQAQADRATALVALGRFGEAMAEFDDVVGGWERLHPSDHPYVLHGRHHRVICYVNLGRHADALAEIDEILRVTEGSRPANDPQLEELRTVRAQLQSMRG